MKKLYKRLFFLSLFFLCINISASGVWAEPTAPLTAMDTQLLRQEQRVITRVQLSADGTLHGTMVLENGRKLWGLCAVSHFAIKDSQGKLLETHSLPEACVREPEDDTVRRVVTWKGKVKDPDTVSKAAEIQIRTLQSPLAEEILSLEELFR